MNNTTKTEAYKKGYRDGHKTGVENNPYKWNDVRRYQYKIGYECGVTRYCEEAHPEEVNQ